MRNWTEHYDNLPLVDLPSRLIDVGISMQGNEDDDPKLYTKQNGEKGRYLTLSYCWGNGPQLKLTK